MGSTRVLTRLLGVCILSAFCLAFPAKAPAQTLGRIVSPILTIDRDRLFNETQFGRRVNAELEAASAAMAAETRKIEAALEEEERQITEQRATLDPAAFRELAQAFDEKVQELRRERETAEANLRSQIEAAQTAFFEQVGPILGALVRERGAVMILDRRAILLAAADVDITEAAIERIDAMIGDGSDTSTLPDVTPDGGDAPLDTLPAPQNDTGTDLAPGDAN